MTCYTTNNIAAAVPLDAIPEVSYAEFYRDVAQRLTDPQCHVAHYFALPGDGRLCCYCILLDDRTAQATIHSYTLDYHHEDALPSLTALHPQLHPFERDIRERYGVRFEAMPWDKPLRWPADRFDRRNTLDDYPFYTMEGASLHEVNVGPIHAGIIEPGAFRFICNGEQVLHLEIALGYQHRGVEHAFEATDNRLRQICLAEAVAGDSAVAHATAFAAAVEKLTGAEPSARLNRERAVALELERMAMQIADTGALSMDVGYQLGQVACEALRTMTINTTQAWCGNRFGKGLIRPSGTNFPLTAEKAAMIRANVAEIARRYDEVRRDIESSPTLLARFEQCGTVTREQMLSLGGVGQAARASGLERDIRTSHPWGVYTTDIRHEGITLADGDVMARLGIRMREVAQSAEYIDRLIAGVVAENSGRTPDNGEHDNRTPDDKQHAGEGCTAALAGTTPDYASPLRPSSLAFSLIEGWRGETCHVLVTDPGGHIAACRIKDPSLHNWTALALALRGEGISDFPICNKSFNLSYCGHDL